MSAMYSASTITMFTDKEYELDTIQETTLILQLQISIDWPVYTAGEEGHQELRYRVREMILDRPYPVLWNGKRYVLRRTALKVEIFKHEDD